ncbi:hypothetical protein C5B90_19120 [Haloferax sp. Atlit-12N]|uniref:hypothetical protein n=1 Tax=Haloferax sp. Atlit-12N TaxID=2077203 RepID=UPI000E27966E|nr:hypothetical protein [Haloferax sp. Atlit-12N]RDZ61386.1 hypothetical protein C5B90_19120 [Haloferax sp. Atlit-12N]
MTDGTLITTTGDEWHHSVAFDGATHTTACGYDLDVRDVQAVDLEVDFTRDDVCRECLPQPDEGDVVYVDRSNESGGYRGVVEDVKDTSYGGRMLVRCEDASCSKATPGMRYSVGLSADWTVVDDE